MLEIYRVLILAVVQGVAEFLPISSSGHLVILGSMMGELGESATLEIILHAGTLGSILVVYWRRILDLLSRDRRVIGLLIIGTLPAVVIGLTIKLKFEWLIRSPLLAGAMLIVTGVMLLILGRLSSRPTAPAEEEPHANANAGDQSASDDSQAVEQASPNDSVTTTPDGSYTRMSWVASFVVGCFQAFAILPGISRSGSTILGGRIMGLNKEDSVTFSFLLAIPAILGATTLAVKDLLKQDVLTHSDEALNASTAGTAQAVVSISSSITTLLAGAAVAFVVGIVALKWLIRWSREDRLHWFAYWCIPAGMAVVAGHLLSA